MYLKNRLSKGKIESIATYKGCNIKDILDEYKKIRNWGEEGTLFIYYENGNISQIHESVYGIEKVEMKLANIVGVPYKWFDSYVYATDEEKEFMVKKVEKGEYIYNIGRNKESIWQFSYEDNKIFWEMQKAGFVEAAGGISEQKMDELKLLFYVFKKDKNAVNLQQLEQWYHLQGFSRNGHPYQDAADLGQLYYYARPFFEEALRFFGRNRSNIEICCYILNMLFEEDKTIFIKKCCRGYFQRYEIKIIFYSLKMIEYKNGFNKKILFNIDSLTSILKEAKWRHATNIEMTCKDKTWYHVRKKRDLLEKQFLEKFNRAPKLIDEICCFNEDEQFVSKFVPKTFSRLLKQYSVYGATKIICSPKLEGLPEVLFQYSEIILKDNKIFSWLAKHKKTQTETLINVCKYYDFIKDRIKEDSTIKEVLSILQENKAFEECNKIKKYYPAFNITEVACDIEKSDIVYNNQRAYILDANDPRQVMLGYDTHCCQHLGGAGESAMMYGLLAKNGGFWAIEKKGKIIAQAEIWTGVIDEREEVLVFDNIELADDRDFNLIREVLEKWLENSPYKNIVMGTGYNVLTYGYKDVKEDIIQPYCEELYGQPYTDTDTCVWLKKGGEVQYV